MTQKHTKNPEKGHFFKQKCHLKVTPKQIVSLFFMETHKLIVDMLGEAIDTIL